MAVPCDYGRERVTAKRWQQIDTILKKALDREPGDRVTLLDEACEGNPSLRKEVEALIVAYERAGRFLESPVLETPPDDDTQSAPGALAGQTLGYYVIMRLLGSGGMGQVYLAEDSRLGRKVALKLLVPALVGDGESRSRFLREARLASALDHPNICTVVPTENSIAVENVVLATRR
jgi:eukaryotic-like serine/threonine-protein kinase